MSDQIGGLGLEQAMARLQPWTPRAPAITASGYAARLARARDRMAEAGADALLIGAGDSLRYFTGLPWGASERLVAMLLLPTGKPIMICPQFEVGSMQADLKVDVELETWEEHESPEALVAAAARAGQVRRLALDPALPFVVHERLRRVLGAVEMFEASSVVDGCRMRKSAEELALMRQATAMTLQVHRLAAGLLREGIARSELVRFIDTAHRALGADDGSTFCIVLFGHATAYPHGLPGEQYLADGDMVLIDTGCRVHGYHSDITRSYVFGKPSSEQRRIWNLEKAAQQAAFDAVRPGVTCEAVDAAARRVLEAGGLGPDYRLPGLPHRTGHGCGLSIHETPYLVRGNETVLDIGMCCSNEPMIVVPGEFGVRLEDHFHVTESGAAWFTEPSPAIDHPFAD